MQMSAAKGKEKLKNAQMYNGRESRYEIQVNEGISTVTKKLGKHLRKIELKTRAKLLKNLPFYKEEEPLRRFLIFYIIGSDLISMK